MMQVTVHCRPRAAPFAVVALLLSSLQPTLAQGRTSNSDAAVLQCASTKPLEAKPIADAPGRNSLGRGLAFVEQRRYAAAYSDLNTALNEGLPDPIERAQAYKQVGLIMCRFGSSKPCEENLLKALRSDAGFSIPAHELTIPGVQGAFERANGRYQASCRTAPPAADKTNTVKANSDPALRVGMPARSSDAASVPTRPATLGTTLVQVPSTKQASSDAVTLILRVKPWGTVKVDGGPEAVTPPVKVLQLRPGEQEIMLKNKNGGDPVIIDANFKAGQTWVVQHNF